MLPDYSSIWRTSPTPHLPTIAVTSWTVILLSHISFWNVQKIIHILFLKTLVKINNDELEKGTILFHSFLNLRAIFVRHVTSLFPLSLQWPYLMHILWAHKPEKQNSVYKFSMLYLSASEKIQRNIQFSNTVDIPHILCTHPREDIYNIKDLYGLVSHNTMIFLVLCFWYLVYITSAETRNLFSSGALQQLCLSSRQEINTAFLKQNAVILKVFRVPIVIEQHSAIGSCVISLQGNISLLLLVLAGKYKSSPWCGMRTEKQNNLSFLSIRRAVLLSSWHPEPKAQFEQVSVGTWPEIDKSDLKFEVRLFFFAIVVLHF